MTRKNSYSLDASLSSSTVWHWSYKKKKHANKLKLKTITPDGESPIIKEWIHSFLPSPNYSPFVKYLYLDLTFTVFVEILGVLKKTTFFNVEKIKVWKSAQLNSWYNNLDIFDRTPVIFIQRILEKGQRMKDEEYNAFWQIWFV